MIPLFERYPTLKKNLPYVELGDFPTPVQRLERLGNVVGMTNLYVKRDDLSATLYGGNKVRKLEFLLSQALRANAKAVLTFGFAGSNHALATAIYAHQMGLQPISILLRQPNAQYVRNNLLVGHYFGAELHHYRHLPSLLIGTTSQFLKHMLQDQAVPFVIPPGGSSPLGGVGFVNAALELQDQISEGVLPEPDYIYVAAGSMGTAVGLMVGLKLTQLKSRVIAVRVVHSTYVNEHRLVNHFNKMNAFLHAQDHSFPIFHVSARDMEIQHAFFGRKYALFTKKGMQAVALMEKYEGIRLEGTYTGKTLAALLSDSLQNQSRKDQVVLFWNTYNSREFSNIVRGLDYHRLPDSFHCYFEEDDQPLDMS